MDLNGTTQVLLHRMGTAVLHKAKIHIGLRPFFFFTLEKSQKGKEIKLLTTIIYRNL